MELTILKMKQWLSNTHDLIEENKSVLTELDQAIGDGDHGINMSRGFQAVNDKISDNTYQDIGELMKDISMTILFKVGGASGPLYGTAFTKMAEVWKGKKSIDEKLFIAGIQAGLQGIQLRGKGKLGEKTMIDVWHQVIFEMEKTGLNPIQIKSAANKALADTKELVATKGRAAYLKERSIGHLDPGSCSSAYLFIALAETLERENH